MNLVIDVGNTRIKLAVFSNNNLVEKQVVKLSCFLAEVIQLKERYNTIDTAILSNVSFLDPDTMARLKAYLKVIQLSAKTHLPFINKYKTPNTLGVDRLALVSAAVKFKPNVNSLIIDAGTCITYDFINNKNEYLGGAISPGVSVRYKSLNNLTSNLPLLPVEVPLGIIGTSTNQAIHSGIVYGVLNEIDGVIATYRTKYSDLTVILTGGDANFLSKQLKSTIFANSNFLLEGLNYILQFNKNQ